MRLLPIAIAVSLASCEAAHAGEFTRFTTPNSSLTALSDDGAYAVSLASGLSGKQCYRWSRADGDEETINGLSDCVGINDAGTIAGSIAVDGGEGSGGHDEAALLAVGAEGPQALPRLDGFANATARSVGADGASASGIAISDTFTTSQAFAWTAAGGTVALPVDSGNSGADRASADGSIVVGWADEPQFGARRAVIWQNGAPMYPTDAQQRNLGEAEAVSSNGRFAVGIGLLDEENVESAWRLDIESGELVPLPGIKVIGGVSDDGRIVVGDSGFLANRLLMVWTQDRGTQTLIDFVAEKGISKPDGWLILTGALNGVSADGSTIGGCCGAESDLSLHSFVVDGLNDRDDALFGANFEVMLADQPVVDSGFEATSVSGGANPFWQGLDTNPDAQPVDGGDPTCFYSAAFGGIATHRGLWSVFFGGWANGAAETQDFSQDVVLPAGAPLYINYWRLVAQLPDAGSLNVLVDGKVVQSTDLSTLPQIDADFSPESADISPYADGESHTIRIEYDYPGGANDGFTYIDDVVVDTSPIARNAREARAERGSVRRLLLVRKDSR